MITQILTILIVITASIYSDNKFMTAVRNITESGNNNGNSNQTKRESNDDNALKDEISKYMKECKSDGSEESSYERDQRREDHRGYKSDNWNSRTPDYDENGSSYYRNKKNSKRRNENDDKNIDAYLTSYGSNYNNNNSRSEEENNYDSKRNSDGDNYNRRNFDNRNYNTNENENYNRQSNGNGRLGETFEVTYPDRNNPYDRNSYNYPSNGNDPSYNSNPYRSGDYGQNNYNERESYPTNGDFARWKRSSENCVSQCIFGYIELLDENSIPSETATIKFLQDHMQNDRKRLKLIRDTRRCFAKLATTENEDGCEFSKSIAKCLKLNIE